MKKLKVFGLICLTIIVFGCSNYSIFVGNEKINSSEDGVGNKSTFKGFNDIKIDSEGNIYVLEFQTNKIKKIAPDGNVSTIAQNDDFFSLAIDSKNIVYVLSRKQNNISIIENNKITKVIEIKEDNIKGSICKGDKDRPKDNFVFGQVIISPQDDLFMIGANCSYKINEINKQYYLTNLENITFYSVSELPYLGNLVTYPKDFIFNKNGELIISYEEDRLNGYSIALLTKENKLIAHYLLKDNHLKFPTKLALDKDENLYFIDADVYKGVSGTDSKFSIKKLDKNSNLSLIADLKTSGIGNILIDKKRNILYFTTNFVINKLYLGG